eukprot:954863-Pleurochrysis_carterae.AAC.1
MKRAKPGGRERQQTSLALPCSLQRQCLSPSRFIFKGGSEHSLRPLTRPSLTSQRVCATPPPSTRAPLKHPCKTLSPGRRIRHVCTAPCPILCGHSSVPLTVHP